VNGELVEHQRAVAAAGDDQRDRSLPGLDVGLPAAEVGGVLDARDEVGVEIVLGEPGLQRLDAGLVTTSGGIQWASVVTDWPPPRERTVTATPDRRAYGTARDGR
jgi:hypothetical protein